MADKLTRAAASLCLAGAAGLLYAAAWDRWWPGCRRGGFEGDACLPLQDHRYDYLVPADPWIPIGHAAELAGAGLLLLAGAALLLPQLVAPSLPRLARWSLATVPAVSLVLLGLGTLLSGLVGEVVTLPLTPAAALIWAVAWPAALTLAACLAASRAPGWRAGWSVVTAVVVGLATPVPVALALGPIAAGGSVSYDSVPWSEAAMAPVLLLAAGTLWLAALGPRRSTVSPKHRLASPRSRGPEIAEGPMKLGGSLHRAHEAGSRWCCRASLAAQPADVPPSRRSSTTIS